MKNKAINKKMLLFLTAALYVLIVLLCMGLKGLIPTFFASWLYCLVLLIDHNGAAVMLMSEGMLLFCYVIQ